MIDNDLVEIEADLVLLSIMRSVYIEKRQKNSIPNKLSSFSSDFITDAFELPTVKIKGLYLTSLLNMDLSYFNEVGDSYLHPEHRLGTGSFYTPNEIVRYMVDDVIKNHLLRLKYMDLKSIKNLIYGNLDLCNDSEMSTLKNGIVTINKYNVIDIASGSGLFLIGYVKRLVELNALLGIDSREMMGLIIGQLYAFDIRPIPLAMLKLCLLDLCVNSDHNMKALVKQFVCLSSIEGDLIYEQSHIRRVMETGGFDTVLGNPPYLGEKGNRESFETIKRTKFGKSCYEGKMDLFYFFIYRGVDMLRDGGLLSFVTTNYFITADGASKLRTFIKGNTAFKTLVNFNHQNVFPSIKGHNMIFTLLKDGDNDEQIDMVYYHSQKPLSKYKFEDLLSGNESQLFNNYTLMNQEVIYSENNLIHLYPNVNNYGVINELKKIDSVQLGSIASVNQGIVSGADKVSVSMLRKKIPAEIVEKYDLKVGKGIFVLNKDEIKEMDFETRSLLKPFYKNSDINNFIVNEDTELSIVYVHDELSSELQGGIETLMQPYKSVLTERREVKNGVRPWFGIQWPRDPNIFENDKIVAPQRSAINRFAWTDKPWYASADVYFITSPNGTIDLKILCAYLNSKLVYYWLYHCGKRKGKDLELYATPLKGIPVPIKLYIGEHNKLIQLIDDIIETLKKNINKDVSSLMVQIDRYIYDLLDLPKEVIEEIEKFYLKHVK